MALLEKLKAAIGVEEAPLTPEQGASAATPGIPDDATLLDLFKKWKKESFDHRWIWERNWMRNIHYVNNRHWITYVQRSNEWRDVRLAKWVPKPVDNKIAQGLEALRAMFASVNISANVRPVGSNPVNVAVASVCEDFLPLLHEEHEMDEVLNEADFWFITTGTAFLHTYLDRDVKYGTIEVPQIDCLDCGYTADDLGEGVCPHCGSVNVQPSPEPRLMPAGRGKTDALSPFELVFPNTYARFADVPYVIRLRWRTKEYYENHPDLAAQVAGRNWSKAPSEQALQLFRSLPFHNDSGVAPFLDSNRGSSSDEEGAPEYEVWVRPCNEYPDGLVFRVLGDSDPIVLHLERSEALPGPIPYRDADGKPVFTFTAAVFQQRGGRVYGASPFDAVISKQNQLNQLDSMLQMIVQRVANPLWLVPKGAEVERFTGEPGLVVRWNPLTVGGNAKPERVDGSNIPATLFQLREQYVAAIEEGLGTFDILKGDKPAGVEAFTAMQLLVERAQGRFTSAFKSRGKMYRDWFKFALEIEREFGPDQRTKAILTPARTWTQKVFENTQLQGAFTVVVEDGSQTPKTQLGMRASVEHLNQMGFIDKTDPDQRYKVYQLFGQAGLSPALDIHMQAALRKQQAFEEWAKNDAAIKVWGQSQMQAFRAYEQQLATMPPAVSNPEPTVDPVTGEQVQQPVDEAALQAAMPKPPSLTQGSPLAWKPWYKADIHKQEFLKWANGDAVQELLTQHPELEPLLVAHLEEINMALMEETALAAPADGGAPGGSAMAMKNSNAESGGVQNVSGGKGKPAQAV